MHPRVWLAALVLAVPPLAIGLTWALLAPVLPATIATHWSGSGPADAFSEVAPMATALLAITGAMLAVGLVLAALRIDGSLRAMLLSFLAGISGVLAGAFVASAGATAQAGSAAEAELGWWLLVLLAAGLLLVAPWLIHPTARGARESAARLPLAATEATAWQGSRSSGVLLGLTVAVLGLAALVVLLLPAAGMGELRLLLGVVLVAAAAATAALARIRVTVDADALRVRSALLGVPLRTIATDRIRAVEAMVVEPMQWGGWGYRGLPGRLAIVLGRGPGIVVTTREGGRFAVTVDDAEVGAAVLARAVEQRRR